jgi:pSer/pThr/pTyr-binding forkhead associated (FHA) protein
MRVRSGDRPGRVLQLRYPATTFGRGAEADYRFAEDTQMSRIHCAISADGERFILRDNESTNGTFVNGNRVTEIELRNGDVVQFGDYELDFVQGSK